MAARTRIDTWIFVFLIAGFTSSLCFADEIVFKDQKGRQTGTVLEENEQGVTVLFPRSSIKSVVKNKQGPAAPAQKTVILENGDDYVTVKIPRQRLQATQGEPQPVLTPAGQAPSPASETELREKMERLEKRLDSVEKSGGAPPGGAPGKGASHEALLKEEMGSLEGVILWQGKPLASAPVKIVMEQYTGFSLAALKQAFGTDKKKTSSELEGVVLETRTDLQGRYSFAQVPPGYYTLYWIPDEASGWVRRIRDSADFEILPGKLATLNIPEKKKQK